MNGCTIDGCGRRLYAFGLCNSHYARQRRGRLHEGKPIGAAPKGPPAQGPSYKRTHRLRSDSCPAQTFPCVAPHLFEGVACDRPALEWALIAGDGLLAAADSLELYNSADGLWTPDEGGHYWPLCRAHHRRLDVARTVLRRVDPADADQLRDPASGFVVRVLEGEKAARLLVDILGGKR